MKTNESHRVRESLGQKDRMRGIENNESDRMRETLGQRDRKQEGQRERERDA